MDEQKQQLIDRLNQAQNILVAVSASPTVDQLAAALGLTLVLNKLNKHGTAVFSGDIPSTIEFLKPEQTIEKNTDSLRDFIIALDKSKADKLRYKVENDVVRIFITPYKTSITDKDLDFSQGDFNVDVVIALGVTEQQDLDTAITSHGRILHDATVASVSTVGQGSLGAINWVDPGASSLSEMMLGLADGLDKKVLDAQIATALLTGIVSATERFRNDKTSPKAMSASAELMAAGANQQLIATQLEAPESPKEPEEPKSDEASPDDAKPTESDNDRDNDIDTQEDTVADESPEPASEPEPVSDPKPELGTIEINHETEPADEPELPPVIQPDVAVDDDGNLRFSDEPEATESSAPSETGRQRMTEAPQINNGDLTANSEPEKLDPPTEELSLPSVQAPLLSHDTAVLPPDAPAASPMQPAPTDWQPPVVPAAQPQAAVLPDPAVPANGVDDARSAVEAALNAAGNAAPLQPIAALNAQPLGPQLTVPAAAAPPSLPNIPNTGFSEPTPGNSPADQTLDMPLPTNAFAGNPLMNAAAPSPSVFPGAPAQPTDAGNGQAPPPPVPPPMLPPLQS